MIDALQPFLEDKKQKLALDGGDLPPFPRTEAEITECLDEMIARIRARARRLSGILN